MQGEFNKYGYIFSLPGEDYTLSLDMYSTENSAIDILLYYYKISPTPIS